MRTKKILRSRKKYLISITRDNFYQHCFPFLTHYQVHTYVTGPLLDEYSQRELFLSLTTYVLLKLFFIRPVVLKCVETKKDKGMR